MQARAHMVVEGMVQGVGFRWFVSRHAEALGVRGYVKNLVNGDVEIMADGDRSLIEEFIRKVKVGPRSAHISDIHLEWKEPSPHAFTHFEIR